MPDESHLSPQGRKYRRGFSPTEVCAGLRRQILTLELKPVQPLDEREISAAYGVSPRAPASAERLEGFNLFPRMTVLENCVLPQMRSVKRDWPSATSEALAQPERMRLADQAQRFPDQVSGGQ